MNNISVLIPNYNKAKYLSDCFESIVNQTVSNWEIYFMDDCSTDNSLEVACWYQSKFPTKIYVFEHNRNEGTSKSLHELIMYSENDVICCLGSDDALSSTAIEEIYTCFEKNKKLEFIYTNFSYCDNQLNRIKSGWSKPIGIGKTNLEDDSVSAMQCFKKSCYIRTPGLDFDVSEAGDKDLIFKLEEVTRPFFLNKELYLYRGLDKGEVSMSRGPGTEQKAYEVFQVVKERTRKRRCTM